MSFEMNMFLLLNCNKQCNRLFHFFFRYTFVLFFAPVYILINLMINVTREPFLCFFFICGVCIYLYEYRLSLSYIFMYMYKYRYRKCDDWLPKCCRFNFIILVGKQKKQTVAYFEYFTHKSSVENCSGLSYML